ncbi:MAG TPA: hypothetical protein VGN51_19365 [Acidimicrobiia bacterium]|jgi:hypothetical protein
MESNQRNGVVGALIVAALGIAVWWIPDFTAFIFFPPLILGVGVGFVARFTDAPRSVLVITATASTAIIFGVYVTRVTSFGAHGDALGMVVVFSALIVAEAALAAGAGAALGRKRRSRNTATTPPVTAP